MKAFLDEHFLLRTESAQRLYHEFAEGMPIIDYHCHLSPRDIAQNRQFRDLTEAWLEGDHYKWRAMRTHGVAERFCTGDADPYEKFERWAKTVPYTVRNPLYHWTHLELRRYFGLEELLSGESANTIYHSASQQLQQADFGARGLLQKMKVELVCTTDDPLDSLEYHQAISQSEFPIKVIPAFRPDKCLGVDDPATFNSYLDQLGELTYSNLDHFLDLLNALQQRIDFFHHHGCRLS
ncbi:MAG: glucuronate isomerase, partial [Bacteroidota bacterium]